MRSHVVIFDPIFRGSRLFYSSIVASGAMQRNFGVEIVTRTNAETDHSRDLLCDIDVTIHQAVSVPHNFWYGKIPENEIIKGIELICELLKSLDVRLVFIAGLNEVYPSLLQKLRAQRASPLEETPIAIVDYDPRYLLREHRLGMLRLSRLRRHLTFLRKRVLINACQRSLPHLRVMILDERVFAADTGVATDPRTNAVFSLLPDPGPPLIVSKTRTPSRAGDPTVLLLVGQQSARKGLASVIDTLSESEHIRSNMKFVLCGTLTPETEYLRPTLVELCPIMDWQDTYLSEFDIQTFYQRSDYVLLPYSTEFHGSSGVLATATSLGKPIVATDHGCVGYRVREYQLGFVYPYNDKQSLTTILRSLPHATTPRYQQFSANCLAYARRNSIERFQQILFEGEAAKHA